MTCSEHNFGRTEHIRMREHLYDLTTIQRGSVAWLMMGGASETVQVRAQIWRLFRPDPRYIGHIVHEIGTGD